MPKDRAPRLTIVTLSLDIGGTERHIAEIAPKLLEDGFDVSVVCLGRPGVQADAVRRRGVRVVGPVAGAAAFNRTGAAPAVALASGIALLAVELVTRRSDIAHFFLPLPYLAGAPLARLARVPRLVMSRRSQNGYQTKRPWLAKQEHRLHRHMDLILANSRRLYDELLGEGADPARTGIIYNGLDLARYLAPFDRVAARRNLGIAPEALVLAIVANLNPYKGHSDLLAALGSIGPELSPDWRLLVIGRDDGLGRSLRSQAEAAGVSENILWLGERQDVPDLLRLSDIGLNVSHEEGFSNAVIEGMAAGLPMLVTDVGGNKEAAPDRHAGLVVPPRMPRAIAEALGHMAADLASRRRMGATAHGRARRHFSLESCVGHYLEAYQALLSGMPMPASIDPREMRLVSEAPPS
jgi:glycosyltransferase involved in cell wall biosynthesis